MTAPAGKLYSIQYLRALACVTIIAYHVSFHFQLQQYVYMASVELFFVISGFVIWTSTCNKELTVREYLRRRFIRVVPLYWAVTLASCLLFLTRKDWVHGTEMSFANILQSLLFIPYFRSTGAIAPIVPQGWTLNLEMVFYLMFAAVIPCGGKRRLWMVTLALCTMTLLGQFFDASHIAVARVLTAPLMLLFALGMLMGWAYLQGWLRDYRLGVVLVGLALAIFALQIGQPRPRGLTRVLYFTLPVLMLAARLVMVEVAGRLPKVPVLAFLGDASYSMYLWHAQLMYVLLWWCDTLRLGRTVWLMLAIELALVLVAIPAYLYIEKPLLKWLNRVMPAR